jgi:cell filamentation protein
MTGSKSPYWNDRSDSYQYPNSTVLKNIPGITDGAELEALELNATIARMPEAIEHIKNKPINLKLWQDLHKILFQDIYEWAGQFRTVQMSKGKTIFAYPENIKSEGIRILKELKLENYLRGLPQSEFPLRLSYYFSECNVLHPFREGNGRIQKLLFSEIINQAGYRIEWKELSTEDHLKGVIEGYHHRFETLANAFEKIIQT